MELLPKELETQLPKLYATEDIKVENKTIYIKYFTPDSNWSWYVAEYDKESKIFFGFVDGLYPEWGYFSLIELKEVKGPLGLKIERDLNFKPTRFKNIKELLWKNL